MLVKRTQGLKVDAQPPLSAQLHPSCDFLSYLPLHLVHRFSNPLPFVLHWVQMMSRRRRRGRADDDP
jgi:hypothetical protein